MEWTTPTPAPLTTRTDIAPAFSPTFDAARSLWATCCTRCRRQRSFSGSMPSPPSGWSRTTCGRMAPRPALMQVFDAEIAGRGAIRPQVVRDQPLGGEGILPEKLRWRRHLVQHVAQRLRAASKVGENAGAISVLVVRGAGVGVVHSMSQRVVEQGGDLGAPLRSPLW